MARRRVASAFVRVVAGWVVGVVAVCAATDRLSAQDLPRALVIATGGTIAGQSQGGQLSGAQLVEAVPALAEVAGIQVEEFSRVGSSAMTPDHWLRLSRRVNEVFRDDAELAGIVVTHGTDTMEETGYFLHLTVDDARPVVMVGSMRVSSAESADGPANLLAAVRVAVSKAARGQGTLVVLNDEIHSARDVRKTDNNRVDTSASVEWGALGVVDADGVFFRRTITTRHTTESELLINPAVDLLPEVPIVADYAGNDASVLRGLDRDRVEAVVVQAFGGGRASPEMRRAASDLAETGVPVVMSSRVPEGRVMGSGEAVAAGLLAAGDLPPHRVRVLMMLAMLGDYDFTGLQRLLDTH